MYDNEQFTNRIAIIAKCNKCNDDILLLTEERKSDNKIFHDLKVGKKARESIYKCSLEINYTYADIRTEPITPFGWKYGKAIKLKDAYKILRSDFKGNTEIIGYILLKDKQQKIISKEEYEKLYSKRH